MHSSHSAELPPSPLQRLTAFFQALGEDQSVIVAFSGGVDSSVVASVASQTLGPLRVTAVFFDTPLVSDEDRAWAHRIANEAHLVLEVIDFDPLIIEAVRYNRADRCYRCKYALMSILLDTYPEALICDGTNADDDPARRPGIRALVELGIASPLRDCALSKNEVRAIAGALGLSNANRPSMPCRAVTLPADTAIVREALQQA